jgi:glutamate racemase
LNFMEREKPIGVFDSGIGGLTVVKRIAAALPEENIVYFGDTARVPYGSKSNDTVIEYSLEDARYLMQKNVKAIVVACNTASSVAMEELRKNFDVPLIGMIEPGAQTAIKTTKNNRVGVIGTRATISNKAYSNKIRELYPEIQVFETACPLFVPLAEEGWIDHKATYEIAEEYLRELRDEQIDTLVLGCTHYPILSKVIQEVIGEDVTLVDSGIVAAEMIKNELDRTNLHTNSNGIGNQELYVSDIPTKFREVAELFLGNPVKDVYKVEVEHLNFLSHKQGK